jgi:hypothetical protein
MSLDQLVTTFISKIPLRGSTILGRTSIFYSNSHFFLQIVYCLYTHKFFGQSNFVLHSIIRTLLLFYGSLCLYIQTKAISWFPHILRVPLRFYYIFVAKPILNYPFCLVEITVSRSSPKPTLCIIYETTIEN